MNEFHLSFCYWPEEFGRSLKWDFVVECDVEYDVWKMIVMLSSERFGDEFFLGFLSVAMIMYSRIDQVTSQKVASI